jgi:hypothetical protein
MMPKETRVAAFMPEMSESLTNVSFDFTMGIVEVLKPNIGLPKSGAYSVVVVEAGQITNRDLCRAVYTYLVPPRWPMGDFLSSFGLPAKLQSLYWLAAASETPDPEPISDNCPLLIENYDKPRSKTVASDYGFKFLGSEGPWLLTVNTDSAVVFLLNLANCTASGMKDCVLKWRDVFLKRQSILRLEEGELTDSLILLAYKFELDNGLLQFRRLSK